ncbi:hypothetical protein QVD17_39503 [Tagetes erecta]|uniref:Uncharacterized protein n=1 Tax=Tagetes erecta TaxID=13708 RepID=A0AAD8JSH8_TARER|nr:hypothetical protein QVD17_39503 [Tagetes erecta]
MLDAINHVNPNELEDIYPQDLSDSESTDDDENDVNGNDDNSDNDNELNKFRLKKVMGIMLMIMLVVRLKWQIEDVNSDDFIPCYQLIKVVESIQIDDDDDDEGQEFIPDVVVEVSQSERKIYEVFTRTRRTTSQVDPSVANSSNLEKYMIENVEGKRKIAEIETVEVAESSKKAKTVIESSSQVSYQVNETIDSLYFNDEVLEVNDIELRKAATKDNPTNIEEIFNYLIRMKHS